MRDFLRCSVTNPVATCSNCITGTTSAEPFYHSVVLCLHQTQKVVPTVPFDSTNEVVVFDSVECRWQNFDLILKNFS